MANDKILKNLSEAEKKQVSALTAGGLSLEEALLEIGIESPKSDSKSLGADELNLGADALINLATGNIPGALSSVFRYGIGKIGDKVRQDKIEQKENEENAKASAKAESEISGATLTQKAGPVLGAAQAALGLVKGQQTDIPEITDSSYGKKAADLLADSYQRGIDPNILAAGRRDIEARRRSMLYQSEGGGGSSGTRYNRDVAANLLANRAGQDLTISASREKDAKLAPYAAELARQDEMTFRKDLAKQEMALKESEAAASLIGAGLDNIIGSLMLGDQLKAETERKKYENV